MEAFKDKYEFLRYFEKTFLFSPAMIIKMTSEWCHQ